MLYIYIIMTTYTASANANGITLSKTGVPDVTRNWNLFQDQMTSVPLIGNLADNFRSSQTRFNYFDSIKDGTSGLVQNQLGIYSPISNPGGVDLSNRTPGYRNTWNPTGSNIKNMRNKFTRKYVANIKPETWLKLKNSDNYLDPPKIYDYHFWDAGMTAERILKSRGGGTSTELASIGTLIDPASGKTETNIARKQLFPMRGNTIQFDSSFMNAIGFSGDSYITAISQAKAVGYPFSYTMNVGCGNACRGNNNCLITNGGSGRALSHYTIGNNAKNAITKGSGNADEKIKLIVLKEWGDKMQVMCHLMNYHLGPNGGTTTLLTNDFPVFCLCLNFQLPCIFTGQTEKKDAGVYKPILPDFKRDSVGDKDMTKRAYGILEFVPGDPVETLKNRIPQIRDNIHRENQLFLQGITQIKNTGRQIKLGGSEVRLTDEYWDIMIADINAIIANNEQQFGRLGTKLSDTVWPTLHKQNDINATGSAVDLYIASMKTQTLIKRVVKNVKYTAQENQSDGRRGKGGKNKLQITRFKTYTEHLKASQGGYTFGFSQTLAVGMNFSEWAMRHRPRQGGGAKMKGGGNSGSKSQASEGGGSGGESKNPTDLWHLFPGDFAQTVEYYEGENDEPGSLFYKQNKGQRVIGENLTQTLYDNFISYLYGRVPEANTLEEKKLDELNSIVATIYTQFCYESWIEGQATTDTPDVRALLVRCEIPLTLLFTFLKPPDRQFVKNKTRQRYNQQRNKWRVKYTRGPSKVGKARLRLRSGSRARDAPYGGGSSKLYRRKRRHKTRKRRKKKKRRKRKTKRKRSSRKRR